MAFKDKEWFDDTSLPNKDITGEKYHRLLAAEYAGKRKRVPYWNCICDCGEETTVSMYNLLNSKTTSCGCHRKEIAEKGRRGKTVNIVGRTFGKLYVIANVGRVNGILSCKVRCKCGTYKIVYKHHLLSGNTRSCGCLYKTKNPPKKIVKKPKKKKKVVSGWTLR